MDFVKLLQNEMIKIYTRPRTWIFLLFVVFIIAATAFINKEISEDFPEGEWKQSVQSQIDSNQQKIENGGATPQLQQETRKLTYYLNNDISPYPRESWMLVKNAVNQITPLIVLFAVIIAGDIVASEFAWGSIKMLMIRPYPRWSFLLAKYITSVLFAVGLILFMLIVAWIFGSIIFGAGGMSHPILSFTEEGKMVSQSTLSYTLKAAGLQMITILLFITIAFMISTLFKSNILAIGISVFLWFSMGVLGSILANFTWAKYLLFTNLNLTYYLQSPEGLMPGMSLPFSLIVNMIYWLLFLLITWVVFQKRDINTT
ncbi:ABC transporter permease [Lentibacillus amyloliquefaciens]|uniref:ABC transporter permease n=1 Tax=Lentibacillus amyloliquefaciens TaxID=1472767 RepID=A0A0U4G7V4_9BACI|nr:DUF2705 family protein [Lentibacillus amyloliquefaciens]ALX48794.1 hypothetical protein AOX59_09305 [Lentibacillus amyloliquefaciens]